MLPNDETFHDFRRLLLDNVDMMSYDMPIGGEHCQDIAKGLDSFYKYNDLSHIIQPYIKTKFEHCYDHKRFSLILRRANKRQQSQYAARHVKYGKSTKIKTEYWIGNFG